MWITYFFFRIITLERNKHSIFHLFLDTKNKLSFLLYINFAKYKLQDEFI